MKFEISIDPDEAAGLIPAYFALERELNEFEEANILEATEWLLARRRGNPLDKRFIHAVHRRKFNKWAAKARCQLPSQAGRNPCVPEWQGRHARLMADLLLMQLADRQFE